MKAVSEGVTNISPSVQEVTLEGTTEEILEVSGITKWTTLGKIALKNSFKECFTEVKSCVNIVLYCIVLYLLN